MAILPGKCQARCRFCIEPEGPPPPSTSAWLTSFESLLLRELPPIFRTISISGGEPTLSPVFAQALDLLAQARAARRIKRVVLTTNGSPKSFAKHLDDIGRVVTHVNISRHAADDDDNAKIFKTTKVPRGDELRDLISQLNRRGIPVNVNCVHSSEQLFGERLAGVSRSYLRAEAKRFISFARSLGASSVVFRHDHRVWDSSRITQLEAAFDDCAVMHEARCESCRVIGKVICGLPVNFKQSAYEPVELHMESELYELVLHSDGVLYRDWSRRHPLERPLEPMAVSEDVRQVLDARPSVRPLLTVPECEPRDASCGLMFASS